MVKIGNVEALRKEREELFEKVYTGKIPKRVPIGFYVFNPFFIQFSGYDLLKTQWDTGKLMVEAAEKFCQEVYADAVPVGHRMVPFPHRVLKSRSMIMVNGFMQHPEIFGMEPEEYDDFIKSPLDTIIEKILPRLFPGLDADPSTKSITLAKGMIAQQQEAGAIGKMRQSLAQKYGYYAGPPGASGGGVKCPFDFISDYIRGFTGILNDIRRIPKKVQEACEAILPYLIHKATPKNPSPFGTITITTHMPAFMRTKDFETLYYPTFKKMIEAFAQQGSGVTVFCESDWMRYLDHLQDLPPNTRLWFESGDPKLAKQKIGDKQILTGFYPLTLLQTGTKQAVVDKAKEIVDILAPGGRYYFDFDKGPIACQDNTRDNLIALSEYLWNNTNY